MIDIRSEFAGAGIEGAILLDGGLEWIGRPASQILIWGITSLEQMLTLPEDPNVVEVTLSSN